MPTDLQIRLQHALEQAGIEGLSLGGEDCFARIRGVHPAVGDIVINVEDEDIIVGAMHMFCHFVDVEPRARNVRRDLAQSLTDRALDYILAVLRDEILFELHIENNKVTNAKVVDLRDRAPVRPSTQLGRKRVERFLWSGPVTAGQSRGGKER